MHAHEIMRQNRNSPHTGRLVAPDGSNAAEAFAAELQPGNGSAQHGLDALADRLRDEAQALVDQGDRAGAVELV